MVSDETTQTKRDLLRELESLREQLADPEATDFSDEDIPILLDKVEQVVANDSSEALDEDTAALEAAYNDITQGLPEQDSPTGAHHNPPPHSPFSLVAEPEKKPTRPIARGENPFLPKHIRDRLQERRQMLADDIAQASSFFPRRSASAPIPAEHQQLIDDVIADYLPRIERDLRRRLQQLLEAPAHDQEQ